MCTGIIGETELPEAIARAIQLHNIYQSGGWAQVFEQSTGSLIRWQWKSY